MNSKSLFSRGLFSFLIILFCQLSLAASEYPASYYRGERITFNGEPLNECGRGKSKVSVYCKSDFADSMKECQAGRVLICRYCNLNDKSLADLNMSLKSLPKMCARLEATSDRAMKVKLTPEEFFNLRSQLVANIQAIVEEISRIGTQEFQSAKDYNIKMSAFIETIEDAAFGPGGIKESFDEFGTSKTIRALRTEAGDIQTELRGLTNYAQKPNSFEKEVWQQRTQHVAALYNALKEKVSALEFKPETKPGAKN